MILVVGPGALGTLLAARLVEGGREVTLLDHDPARAERLARDGVRVEGPGQLPVRRVSLPVRADARGLRPALVLLCVKTGATNAAVAALAGLEELPALAGRPSSATVVVMQNGLSRGAVVGGLLDDPGRVVGGTTSEGATLLGEGHVRHAGSGLTRLAALRPEQRARAEAAAAELRAGWFTVEVCPDLARLEWEKLVVNAAINALTGLLGCKNGALLDAAAAREMAQAAAEEAAAVARARKVAGDWSAAAVKERWETVARATAGNTSSTLQDLRRGRATEVHAINGAVARAAQKLGLPAPVNAALAALTLAREQLGARSEA